MKCFLQGKTLGAGCKMAFYQEQANKIAERGTGSATGNTNVSHHGVCALLCFSDKCCLVADACTGSSQLLRLILILAMLEVLLQNSSESWLPGLGDAARAAMALASKLRADLLPAPLPARSPCWDVGSQPAGLALGKRHMSWGWAAERGRQLIQGPCSARGRPDGSGRHVEGGPSAVESRDLSSKSPVPLPSCAA